MLGYIVKLNAINIKVNYASLVSTFSQEDPPELAGWELEPELELELPPERVLSRSTTSGSFVSCKINTKVILLWIIDNNDVFTNPESTIFSTKLFFFFYKVEVFDWDNKLIWKMHYLYHFNRKRFLEALEKNFRKKFVDSGFVKTLQ